MHTNTTGATTVRLPGKLQAQIVPAPSTGSASLMRQAASAELYIICGAINLDRLTACGQPVTIWPRTTTPTSPLQPAAGHTRPNSTPAVHATGAYVGEATRLARVGHSVRKWVQQDGVIDPTHVVLIHRRRGRRPLTDAARLTLEAALVRHLGERVLLTNVRSRTSAVDQLTREQVHALDAVAQLITRHIVRRVFAGKLSPVLGGTQRTQLIRLVRREGRTQGLDTRQIVQLAQQAGLTLAGPLPTQTCRRDLGARARADRVRPPVFVTWHEGKTRVFYHPDLGKREALRTYQASLAAGS